MRTVSPDSIAYRRAERQAAKRVPPSAMAGEIARILELQRQVRRAKLRCDAGAHPMAKRKTNPEDALRKLVQAEMDRQDHTISETARQAKIDRLTLSRWLTGERGMRSGDLLRVMDYLGIVAEPTRQ